MGWGVLWSTKIISVHRFPQHCCGHFSANLAAFENIMKDLMEEEVDSIGVYTDASAAIGMVQRQGMGRVRHIDVGILWIQQHQKNGSVEVSLSLGRRHMVPGSG